MGQRQVRPTDGTPRIGNTLDDAARRYVAVRLEDRELRPHTARNWESILLRFSCSYGRRPLGSFGPQAVRDWKKSIAHLRGGTPELHKAVVRMWLCWLATEYPYTVEVTAPDGANERETRYLPNVSKAVGKKDRSKVDRTPRALEGDQVRALLAVLPDRRWTAIVLLMLYPGLRCCEITRMRAADWDGSLLKVRGKGARHVKVGHREYPEMTRRVPIGEQCEKALKAWLDERGRHAGPMFPGRREDGDEGIIQTHISKTVTDFMWAAGIKKSNRDGMSAHALRHTCATDALEDGVDIVVVAELLGHDDLSTTRRYTHVKKRHLDRAVNRADYRSVLLPPPTGAPVDLPPPMPLAGT